MPTTPDINNRFNYHAPIGNQVNAYQTIRNEARALAHFLNEVVPDGRELSLALTHLEDAVFWANAGIARNLTGAHVEISEDGKLDRYIKD